MLKENFITVVQDNYELKQRNKRAMEYSNSKTNKIIKLWWKIKGYVLDTITVLLMLGVLYVFYIILCLK